MKLKLLLSVISLILIVNVFGQNSSVIDSLDQVIKNAKEDTNKVISLNQLGFELRKGGQMDKALQSENEAITIAHKLNYKKGLAVAYRNSGIIYLYKSDFPNALSMANKGIGVSAEIGYKQITASCYNIIALVYTNQGNFPEAIKNHTLSLKIKKEIRYKIGIAESYRNIGAIYRVQGDYPKALENFKACKKICEEIGAKDGLAISYNDIANIDLRQGNYPEALKNLFTALQIMEGIPNKDMSGISRIYHDIGIIYIETGNYMEALKYFTLGLKIDTEIGNQDGISTAYDNLGIIYQRLGNDDKALEYYLAAVEKKNEFGYNYNGGTALFNIGDLYRHRGNYSKSLEYFMMSLKAYEEKEEKHDMASAYLGIGNVYYEMGKNKNDTSSPNDYNKSYQYLRKGMPIVKELGDKLNLSNGYLLWSEVDSAMEKFPQALEHYKMYVLYKDSLLNEKSNKQMASLKIQYETEKKDQEIELLNKENNIKALQVEQQKTSLLASNLELDNNRKEILLLNKSKELQELQLAKTKEDLDHQRLEVKAKTAGIALIEKEKELQKQQLARQKLLRNGILAGTLLLILMGLLLFRSLHLRKQLEKQGAIIQERKRISADLHDDIGSGLSRISFLSDMVMREAKTTEAKTEAEKIVSTSRRLLESINEIIWALNANNDHVENLVSYIRRYAAEYFENSTAKLSIIVPANIPEIPISGEYRRNIFYAVKEALHNILKHATATEAELHFSVKRNLLSVVIHDNGKGIPEGELNRFGNGMKNMRSRLESISGSFTIENHSGTKITLVLPV